MTRVAEQCKVGGIWLPANNICNIQHDVKSADGRRQKSAEWVSKA